MIDVKDLRVGNWLLYRSYEDCINDTGYFEDLHSQIMAEDLEPFEQQMNWARKHSGIFINEEVLADTLKKRDPFSFVGDHTNRQFYNYDISKEVYIKTDQGYSTYTLKVGEIEIARISYIHELQNWVWLLTKKELEINLTQTA